MTHSDLLLLASDPFWLTPDDAGSLVSAHERLLEERDALRRERDESVAAHRRCADGHLEIEDALREQLREVESDHDRAASVARMALARSEAAEMERTQLGRDLLAMTTALRLVEAHRDVALRERDAARSSLSRLRGQVEALARALRVAIKELEWWGDHFHDEPGDGTEHYVNALTGGRAALRSLVNESAEDHKDKGGEP